MEYTQIGYTRKTHGVAGEIKVVIEEVFEPLFLEADRVFLEIKGAKMPYFIENIRGGGDLIVQFEEVDSKEAAFLLQSRPIFLFSKEIPETLAVEDDEMEFARFEGFELYDETQGLIGAIEAVLDMPQQEMALVHYKKREVLIPLHEQWIVQLDEKNKRITLRLPDGLLDL